MKNTLLLISCMVFTALSLEAQSLQITSADTAVQGHVSESTQVGAKVTVKNISSTPKDFLVKRIDKNYNSLTDSNAFCWGALCYQPHISVAPLAQTIQPGEEFKGFIGYVYPDAGAGPMIGNIRYVFFAAGDPNDSISHTITYETTADFSLSEKQVPVVQLYPNPTSGLTTVQIDGVENQNLRLEIINLVGKTLRSIPIPIGENRVTFDAATLAPGVYFYRMQSGDDALLTRKLVVR